MSESADAGRPDPDRRRHPRVAILEQVHGQFVSLDVPVQTLDMGAGGFAIASPVAFPLDEVHEFLLTRDDGVSQLVTARVAHCAPAETGDDARRYVTGFEFVLDDERTRRAVTALVEYLGSAPDVI